MSRPPLGSTLDVFGLSLSWYSLLIMTGVAIGIVLATREEKRLGLPKDTVINFALLAIPLGLVGARLYYVAFTWRRFAGDPLEILRIWNGGLAIYGGILGGILAAWLVTRRRKGLFWQLLDACMPSLALGQAIGRWGNYANMEAYGARVYDAAAQFFPLAVEIPIVGTGGVVHWYWHMATFFYESLWCAVVFALLWAFRKRMPRRGDVTLWYALLYCAGRTVIEGLRDDSLMLNVAAAQVRVSQVLSAAVCLGVVALFFTRLKRVRRVRFGDWLCLGIAGMALVCVFVSEFERNAYLGLFTVTQAMVAVLAALDLLLLVHYGRRVRRVDARAVWMLLGILACGGLLAVGAGRMGGGNVGFIAIRQAVGMAHVALCGAWLYLRGSKIHAQKTPEIRQEASVL